MRRYTVEGDWQGQTIRATLDADSDDAALSLVRALWDNSGRRGATGLRVVEVQDSPGRAIDEFLRVEGRGAMTREQAGEAPVEPLGEDPPEAGLVGGPE